MFVYEPKMYGILNTLENLQRSQVSKKELWKAKTRCYEVHEPSFFSINKMKDNPYPPSEPGFFLLRKPGHLAYLREE